MSEAPPERPGGDGRLGRGPLRVWHLVLLVAFVAIAIANIQDQRIREPKLIAIAAGGFVLYGVLGWLGWRVAQRVEPRVGARAALILYLVAMAALFLAATAVYLVVEYAYRNGL